MKNITSLLFLLSSFALSAQTEKGAAPLAANGQQPTATGTTRAVVIGISDYQDDKIPDLRFADRDAEAFANFLRSPAGGNLGNDQIVLLTNAKATTAQFSAALDWLIEQSKDGDQAIIYFSGHGDVETKTIANWGFLLTYTTPPTNYIAGAFPIYYLQSVISTLAQKNVRVLMISDACRAGKLAGSEFDGPQATAANLSKQFANEVKIMSCQPDEFSIEGEQWGGGRGAFSWHLVEGLTGMADKNADQKVQLLEIENYLEEILPKETAPQSQIPMTVGSKSSTVAFVDESSLAQLKQRKATEMPNLAKVETKGFEQTVLENADTSVQELYAAFLTAIEQGDLLEPAGKSANDLYERLIREESLAALHGFMKRNLAAALHDEAQVAINLYLSTDSVELAKRSQLDSSYFRYPKYLNRAADLLGEEHYMYRNLRGKQFYFKGLLVRLNRDFLSSTTNVPWDSVLTAKALAFQLQALEHETRAAFIYHEIANLYRGRGEAQKALQYSQKSAELSPRWGLTLHYYGNDLFYAAEKFEEAIEIYKKALEVAPHYTQIYFSLGMAFRRLNRYHEAELWFDKAVEMNPNNYQVLFSTAYHYILLSKFEQLENIARKMVVCAPAVGKNLSRDFLAVALSGQGKHAAALEIFESLVGAYIPPGSNYLLAQIGMEKIELGNPEAGEAYLQKAMESEQVDEKLLTYVAQGYLKLNRPREAARYFEQAFREAQKITHGGFHSSIYELVWSCAWEGETALALQWLETILKEGYDDYGRLQHDEALTELRKTQKFKDLMKQYFPGKAKD